MNRKIFYLVIVCSLTPVLALTTLFGLNEVAFAQTIYFDDSDPDYLKLGNASFYEVGFRKTNGSIAYILDKSTGANLTAGSRNEHLWGALFYDSEWIYRGGGFYNSASSDSFYYFWNSSDQTLTLYYTPGPLSDLKVRADVLVSPSESYYFDLVLDIDHDFGGFLEYVSFPSELVFLDNQIDEALLPIIPGVILEPYFFLENRDYTTSYPGWPGVFSDLISLKMQNGNFAIYTLYDFAHFQRIIKIGIGFISDDEYIANSTYLKHEFRTYITDSQELDGPAVRIHIGQTHKTVIENFRVDNHIDQYPPIVQKLGDDFDRVSRSPLVKVDFEIRFPDYDSILEQLPSPAILHPPSVHAGGFDRNYPDVLPPDPNYGTIEELRALYERVQARGMMVMPYSNPTWWDDDSPTIQNELPPLTIDDIIVIETYGPHWETYGDNSGPVVSPNHPFVIQRLNRLMTELTEDIPSDFVFEDQIGARGPLLDLNASAPSPWSYSNGWLEHTRRHAHIGLGTEMGFDRLLETENFFCGSTQLFKLKIGSTSDWWGDDNWHNYPMTSFMANDKILFYQHNLDEATMTISLEMLSWNLAFGFMTSYWALNYPNSITDWLDVAAQFQSHVVSRYAGERMTDYVELQPGITQSVFPSVTVTTNWDEASPFSMYGHTIPPQGTMVTSNDGSMTAGSFNVYNDSVLTAGEHYLIVERFFEQDSIRVWQPKGDDTPITVDLQSLSATENIHCYGFAGNIIFQAPIEVNGQYGTFEWNRDYEGKEVDHYVITTGPIYLTSPNLAEPADWATLTVPSPIFRWQSVEGATSYQVQISTDKTFQQTVVDNAAITQTEFSTDILEAGTTYFWRVQASNASHTSNWSAVRRFRMHGLNLVDRLVVYYPLNGTAKDLVGDSDGTLMGDVSPAPDRFGNTDYAYSFDGDEDYITFPESGAYTSIDKQVTVSCWIYPRSFAFEMGLMIRDRFWRLMLNWNGSVFGNIFNEENNENRVASNDHVSLDTWSLAAFTYDGQTIKIYINGEPSGELEYPTIRIGQEGMLSTPTLGKGIGLTQVYFNGVIDDVRIYDRALNTEEMAELYRKTVTENFPPEIVTFSPAIDTVITEGDSLEFSIAVQDEDNDELFCTWYYDETIIAIDTTTNDTSTILIHFPLGSVGTHSVRASVSDGELLADTTWNITVEELATGVQLDDNIPTEYLLNQNYPNPFNPSTTISYQLPQPGNVKISVFNVAGQLVETLVDEHKKAGYHSVIWRASGVGSGLYFYRIKAGDYVAMKKCIVMK